jgi:hypothetical protein
MSDTMTATRMRRQARLMRVVNVPMRRLLALPVRTPLSGRLMLITFTGRKTGRVYRQPVSFVRDGATLLTPGGGTWTRNLEDGRPVRARLAGRGRTLWPEMIRDPDAVGDALRTMVAASPGAARFIPFIGPGGAIDPTRLANAVAHGFRVVRWHVDEPFGA